MRSVILILALAVLAGCAYQSEVKTLSDEELCSNLGYFTVRDHEEGVRLSRDEIERRNIDKARCSAIANETIERQRPKYKQSLCERMAQHHYEGEYRAFKATLDKILSRGFDDQECLTIAQFYLRQQEREREDRQRIAEAIGEASQEMFGRGSYNNPIHINLQ